jgi:hypothetical protein
VIQTWAEGVGFEPTRTVTSPGRFQGACTRPLCEPSRHDHDSGTRFPFGSVDLGGGATMVCCMPRNEQDPAGSTQQFRAFASDRESAGRGSSPALIIGVAGAVLVVAVLLVMLFVG